MADISLSWEDTEVDQDQAQLREGDSYQAQRNKIPDEWRQYQYAGSEQSLRQKETQKQHL
ncbi:MAG: hypothetical protein RR510_08835 [Morganella sp. (in: enterobacteria)]